MRRTASDIEETRQRASDAAWVDAHMRSPARRRQQPDRTPRLRRLVEGRPDWYVDAACKGQTDLMFEVPAHVEPALAICAGCPVREPCRAQGYRDREFGVWGGSTEIDRSRAGRGNPMMTGSASRAQAEHRARSNG
jgi:WhiB family redox-sensing transcriptional regulator